MRIIYILNSFTNIYKKIFNDIIEKIYNYNYISIVYKNNSRNFRRYISI